MYDDWDEKRRLLEVLREKLSELLCSEYVSEEEKLARIQRVKAIFELEGV